MKKKHLLTLLPIILLALLLAACGTPDEAGSWPGVSVDADAGLAYVAYRQHVYAVQLDNGIERWHFPADNGSFASFAPPELSSDGRLLVSGYDHVLYSLNAATGALQWSFSGGSNRYVGSALAGEGLVYAPNADHKLYALDANGNLQWSFSSAEPLWSQPASDGNAVYLAGMDHYVYALDAQSGQELWSLDLGGTTVGSPLLGPDGLLYVGTLSQTVVAVDTQTRHQAWSFDTQGWVWGEAALVEGTLFIGDLEGFVYALDAARGNELWRSNTGGAITGAPALFDGSLYVVNEEGRLLAINPEDGGSRELALPQSYAGALYGSPVAAGELLLIGLTQNNNLLIALDNAGSVAWSFAP